jgi:hypothetical protein
MKGVRTTAERITDSLGHFDTTQMEINCLFCNFGILGFEIVVFWVLQLWYSGFCNCGIFGYDILLPVMGY